MERGMDIWFLSNTSVIIVSNFRTGGACAPKRAPLRPTSGSASTQTLSNCGRWQTAERGGQYNTVSHSVE